MLVQEYVWRLHIEFIVMVSLIYVATNMSRKEEAKVVLFIEIRIIWLLKYYYRSKIEIPII